MQFSAFHGAPRSIFHYSVQNSPQLQPILSQKNSIPVVLCKIRSNNILPSMSRVPDKTLYRILIFPYMLHVPPISYSLFVYPNNVFNGIFYAVPQRAGPCNGCLFLPLRSTYGPPCPYLKFIFLAQCDKQSLTPMQSTVKIIFYIHFNTYVSK
jgi:hypothetical protein